MFDILGYYKVAFHFVVTPVVNVIRLDIERRQFQMDTNNSVYYIRKIFARHTINSSFYYINIT